jgi:hypothetical protein
MVFFFNDTATTEIYTDDKNAAALRKAGADGDLGSWLKAHLARSGADDYVALLAYIERDAAHIEALQQMRLEVRDSRHVATCAEFKARVFIECQLVLPDGRPRETPRPEFTLAAPSQRSP